jgi:Zn-dependent protease with chaperone function
MTHWMIVDGAVRLQLKQPQTYDRLAMTHDLGRSLVIFGAVIVLIGGLVMLAGKMPFVGRLPGDIVVKKGNFTLYAPLMTGLILSLLLTLVLNLWSRRQ